jgi:uncharacterized protein (TIGR02453 family)
MKPAVPGFPPEGLAFLRGLKKHNKREWFQARKQIYDEQVKAPMVELITALQCEMAEFAPQYLGDPRKMVYRIYRDTRFSKDKTPYKTNVACSFNPRDRVKHSAAGFYFSVSLEEVAVGGGAYMPQPPDLLAIRSRIAERPDQFRKILADRTTRKLLGDMQGEQLSRVPKGFAADHPEADLLRNKQFLLYIVLDPKIAAGAGLYKELITRFRAMTPFINFLNGI